jgi:hypothetical protein
MAETTLPKQVHDQEAEANLRQWLQQIYGIPGMEDPCLLALRALKTERANHMYANARVMVGLTAADLKGQLSMMQEALSRMRRNVELISQHEITLAQSGSEND